MSHERLTYYLRLVGWVAIISYPFSLLVSITLRYDTLQSFATENESFLFYAASYLVGSLIDIPLSVAIPVLCLFASKYLDKPSQTIKEIFE